MDDSANTTPPLSGAEDKITEDTNIANVAFEHHKAPPSTPAPSTSGDTISRMFHTHVKQETPEAAGERAETATAYTETYVAAPVGTSAPTEADAPMETSHEGDSGSDEEPQDIQGRILRVLQHIDRMRFASASTLRASPVPLDVGSNVFFTATL